MRVSSNQARGFYEIEAVQQNWNARELERQVQSLLFERLAKSRDKHSVMRLATKGQGIQQPSDVFTDPLVMEFLGLPESHRLVETRLEEALITNLQHFLLELGKGFAFLARQERLTLEGDHFYVDLVFYHTILKCYVLIDLKVRKLTHEDIGQMQIYVNYYDQDRRTAGDNPTLGLILCTDQNETAVRYTLGAGQQKIFASRYQFHLPTEADHAARDVPEKITLIKDIACTDPIRAHLEILNDFARANLDADFGVSNFVRLHEAWQKRLGFYALSNDFYREIADWYFWAHHQVEDGAIRFPLHCDTEQEKSLFLIRLLSRWGWRRELNDVQIPVPE